METNNTLAVESGEKQKWPVVVSFGGDFSAIRSNRDARTNILAVK